MTKTVGHWLTIGECNRATEAVPVTVHQIHATAGARPPTTGSLPRCNPELVLTRCAIRIWGRGSNQRDKSFFRQAHRRSFDVKSRVLVSLSDLFGKITQPIDASSVLFSSFGKKLSKINDERWTLTLPHTRNSRDNLTSVSGACRCGKWPASSIAMKLALGISAATCRPMTGGHKKSCAPEATSTGARIDAQSAAVISSLARASDNSA